LEDLNKIVKLRDELIDKREKLKREIEIIDEVISILEKIIREKSYVPASELAKREVKEEVKPVSVTPMRTVTLVRHEDRVVCSADIFEDRVSVNISPSIELSTGDRLVKYLIREMEKYLEEDLKAQVEGRLPPTQRFFFSIDEDEAGNLTKIEFIDHGREDRRRDLLGKIRWAINRFISEKERA